MSEPFIGEIRMFGFNYAPENWALCKGDLMPISQNPALFALINTYFGGDGYNTMGLPDFRGRVPISQGRHPGSLFDYQMGNFGGYEVNTLAVDQLPPHDHELKTNPNPASTANSAGNSFGGHLAYVSGNATQVMDYSSVGTTGKGDPIENRMPFQVLNFCIALEGIFPPRS